MRHEAKVLSPLFHTSSLDRHSKDMERGASSSHTEFSGIVFPPRRSKLLSHQMRHEVTSALVQAISCLDYSHSIFSLIGPLGSESQLFIVRSRRPADDPWPIEASYLFFANAKRGYLLCTIRDRDPLWTMVSLPPLAPLPFVSNVCFDVLSDAHAARTACCRRQSSVGFLTGTTPMVFKP